jgi:hypothetical protein
MTSTLLTARAKKHPYEKNLSVFLTSSIFTLDLGVALDTGLGNLATKFALENTNKLLTRIEDASSAAQQIPRAFAEGGAA